MSNWLNVHFVTQVQHHAFAYESIFCKLTLFAMKTNWFAKLFCGSFESTKLKMTCVKGFPYCESTTANTNFLSLAFRRGKICNSSD